MDRSASGSPALLAAVGLSRNFGGLAALRDVSIALRPSELHAVIGPNGAGKSTLVNVLSGHLRPSAGTIRLAGHDVTGEPCWRMAKLGVGRSFQRTNILKPLTVLENVRLAAQATHWHRPALAWASREHGLVRRAKDALARVGLADAAEEIAGTLSHGSQRQLEIAMCLASDPKVLLLDEPLAGMGPEEGERMAQLLKSLAREHAVLLIEHDMDFVFAVADWMTVLVEGVVLAEGSPSVVRAEPKVQEAYLGGSA